MKLDEMWGRLEDIGVNEQTLQIITDINGYNEETLTDVLFAFTGYRNFQELDSDY